MFVWAGVTAWRASRLIPRRRRWPVVEITFAQFGVRWGRPILKARPRPFFSEHFGWRQTVITLRPDIAKDFPGFRVDHDLTRGFTIGGLKPKAAKPSAFHLNMGEPLLAERAYNLILDLICQGNSCQHA
jgi:hypothetical protein